jgi:hypothetical protein
MLRNPVETDFVIEMHPTTIENPVRSHRHSAGVRYVSGGWRSRRGRGPDQSALPDRQGMEKGSAKSRQRNPHKTGI